MHESLDGNEFRSSKPETEFADVIEIAGHEILVTENCVGVYTYDETFSRYDHLRINPDCADSILYFPQDRDELVKWGKQVAPIVGLEPEDRVRELFWEARADEGLTEEDIAERTKVMKAKADRLLAEGGDITKGLTSLLGNS